ncbi:MULTISPECIES: LysR family transcriptional regulator [unclassified Thermoactinomyces]|jgi:LysR family transcriptional activator of glutamate synthase operon|uniref:LysR family transcriptional regulator n=1 Tax=unclassified Thermoactinomyces TaxID=2634588 RepID=UPI0018DD95FA|nr:MULTISPECIES: LysR family transcriptional regulator [unclassified Thermoactinomyces]MBH8598376.1 LysR family transcriptional regulator [Thermoactinomyces sp. CICC 10523]MBH8604501.1 LysR family transcriptional regulator [Thermoactinomyces sp. CICC 10522]MBH8607496.1 LysR family transcriptional regulator [Thermoactinomyces sp. CICC 10521]
MNVEWLEAFLITAKAKSLTKASEQLHMTQPALSKQMRKLEEDLGATLFIRSATGVELTEAGKILFEEIEPVLRKIHSIRKDILMTKGITGIKIGTWPSIAAFYLPDRLAAAKKSHKDREISIKVSYSYKEILRFLREGIIDVALLDDREIQHPYWSKQLFSEPFYLFVHRQHPLAKRDHIYFNDVKDESLVVLPPSCDVRILLEKAFKIHNADLKISSEIDFGQSIIGFISANLGVSILPEIFTHHADQSRIKALPIVDFKMKRVISLISRNPDMGKLLLSLLFSPY